MKHASWPLTHRYTSVLCSARTLAVHWCVCGGGDKEEKQLDVTMLYCCEIHKFLSRNKHKEIIKITNIIHAEARGYKKQQVVATSSKLRLYELKVCVRARHRCAFKTHVRAWCTRMEQASRSGEASTYVDETSHREASHLIKLGSGFPLPYVINKQTRTVANLAYTSVTIHLPNK